MAARRVRRQKEKRVVERRAAAGGLVLYVLLGRHRRAGALDVGMRSARHNKAAEIPSGKGRAAGQRGVIHAPDSLRDAKAAGHHEAQFPARPAGHLVAQGAPSSINAVAQSFSVRTSRRAAGLSRQAVRSSADTPCAPASASGT
jgi:hypothetical protein